MLHIMLLNKYWTASNKNQLAKSRLIGAHVRLSGSFEGFCFRLHTTVSRTLSITTLLLQIQK